MQTFGRALLAYWGVYALDFVTSMFFISLGYGFAESNPAQAGLFASPGLASLAYWVANQNIWLVVGVGGAVAFTLRRESASAVYLPFVLGFMALIRLFGVASNVTFTLWATLGLQSTPLLCYALFLAPLTLVFRADIGRSLRLARSKLPFTR